MNPICISLTNHSVKHLDRVSHLGSRSFLQRNQDLTITGFL